MTRLSCSILEIQVLGLIKILDEFQVPHCRSVPVSMVNVQCFDADLKSSMFVVNVVLGCFTGLGSLSNLIYSRIGTIHQFIN